MTYSSEIDKLGKTIKEYEIDKFGNEEISYIDENIEEFKPFDLFINVLNSYKLELQINEELYTDGNISKELYSKVTNVILNKISSLNKILNV